MKNNIIDGDILWATYGYLELIFDGIAEGNNDEYRQLGIFEWSADGFKWGTLPGLKDNF